MVVRELLVAMRDAKLVQPPYESTGTVKQIELIFVAAIDVKRLQPAEIVCLGFHRDDRVLPQPIRPAFLDDLAGVEGDGQPGTEKLRRDRATWCHTPSNWDYRNYRSRCFVEAAVPLYSGALTRM